MGDRQSGPRLAGDSVDGILAEWARERPDLDFAPVGIVTRIARVRSYLDAGLNEVFARYDLTSPDFSVIVALRRAGFPYTLPQSALMTRLGLTSGTISVRMDRLDRKGIVSRAPDPHDARGVLVALTERGVQLFDQVAPAHLANEDRLLSALDGEERAALAALLRKLLLSFERDAVDLPFGLTVTPAHAARALRAGVGLSDRPGLLVTEVVPSSPAAAAGILRGDLLVSIDGRELRCPLALEEAMTSAGPLELQVLRGERTLALALEAGEKGSGDHGNRD